ncbi:MAG: hypothetical protein NVSMB17_07180 [Candidatus Dormibacteria bacterium]
MPIYDEPPPPASAIKVSPSAALELFWISFRCQGSPGMPALRAAPGSASGLARRTRVFWSEGDEGFPELIVIASRREMLAGESLDAFLADLPDTALRSDDLVLESETAATRRLIIDRLDRLAEDRKLRRRYLALLRELWDSVRADWELNGLPAVRAAALAAERRLAAGERPADLAPRVSEPSLALLDRPGRAALLICPGYFAGRCVWDLPGTLLLGFGTDAGGELTDLRARAQVLAQQLKAIADPTRLTIVMRLARGPATITGLARDLAISQPAVSMHFKVLRGAGIVVGQRDGNRTAYRIDSDRVSAMLQELAQVMPRP